MAPTNEKQKLEIAKALEQNELKVGDTGYLLSFRWFSKWKKVTGFENEEIDPEIKLGEIDNNHLLDKDQIKITIMDNYDYICIPEAVYKLFFDWYGGGPEITVEMINNPATNTPVPLIIKWHLKIIFSDQEFEILTNRYEYVRDIKKRACEHFGINPDATYLVDYWNKNVLSIFRDDFYLEQCYIINTQEILLKLKTDNRNTSSRGKFTISRTNSSMSSGITPIIATPQTLGHVGLDNIGNTCYINSSLQVLAHTELLFQYFESGLWRRELNEQNPKGTGGIVAHQFAQLINDIWTKKQKVISPYDLKNSIGKFHPQFNNSQQQDSQEFLLCLLSDLSGDLNRVTKRCYIEGVVGDGTNDNETADLAWKRHKLLFDSAIVDIFHGQLRTEVKCDECGNKKVVFDAYSSLSIPISKTNLETIRYMYIPADLKRPRYIVKILVSEDQEIDDIFDDAQTRFKAEDLYIFPRDFLSSEFKITASKTVKKIDFYAIERSCSSMQVLMNIVVPKSKVRGQFEVLDGPILIESPSKSKKLEEIVEEKIKFIYEKSKYPTTDKMRAFEQSLTHSSEIDFKNQKFSIKLNFNSNFDEENDEYGDISNQSIKVILNPEFTKESLGFNWGSLCPLDYGYDGSFPCNQTDYGLEEWIKQMSFPQKFENFNKWFCPHCKKFVNAVVNATIWSVADVLIMQLQRFTQENGEYKKLNVVVDFPTEIDMSPYLVGPQKDKEQKYRLYAYINHIGTLNGGHYTANIFDSTDESWYTYNDEAVYKASSNTKSSNPYILFYKRI